MASNLKQEVLDKIIATEDEDLLQLIKAEIEYFTHEGSADVTDGLTAEEQAELITLANEPDEQDVHTLEEFEKATQKWRTK